jgi:hypothetical protein
MITVLRWIDTPVCRRRVEIDVHDFLLSERELAKKYGVPWDPSLRRVLTSLAMVAVGFYFGLAFTRGV